MRAQRTPVTCRRHPYIEHCQLEISACRGAGFQPARGLARGGGKVGEEASLEGGRGADEGSEVLVYPPEIASECWQHLYLCPQRAVWAALTEMTGVLSRRRWILVAFPQRTLGSLPGLPAPGIVA